MKTRKQKFLVLLVLVLLLIDLLFVIGMNKGLSADLGAKAEEHIFNTEKILSASAQISEKEEVEETDEEKASSNEFLSLLGNRLDAQPLQVTGGIAIPDLEINLPTFEGVGDEQILYGAGTFGEGDFGEGNLALASHRVFYLDGADDYLFSPLTQAEKGMNIYLTDQKYIYKYEVDKLLVVDENDGSVLESPSDKAIITLVYCVNFDGPDRGIVQASLLSKKLFSESEEYVKAYFLKDYNQIPSSQIEGL